MYHKKALLFSLFTFYLSNNAFAQKNTESAYFYSPPDIDHIYSGTNDQIIPLNLHQYNYEEKELFMSGRANIYDYTDEFFSDDTEISEQNIPYTNRILIREPIDKSKLSGNIIIEIINDQLGHDIPIVWSQAWRQFIHNGDIWVGITSRPVGIDSLKSFSPERYKDLSWPQSPTACTSNKTDQGGVYDMITTLGNSIKFGNSPSTNPLYNIHPKHLYLTGYSQGALVLLTYNRVIAPNSTLFDGYMQVAGGFRDIINSCHQFLAPPQFRGGPRSQTAAIMQVQTKSELMFDASIPFNLLPIQSNSDSDASNNRYRYYDLAGTAHTSDTIVNAQPKIDDMQKSGGIIVTSDQAKKACSFPIERIAEYIEINKFPNYQIYDALWMNLENWVISGNTPPHTKRMNARPNGGVPLNGWRSPAVDVPTRLYFTGNPIPTLRTAFGKNLTQPSDLTGLCFGIGFDYPIPNDGIGLLYSSKEDYNEKLKQDTEKLVSEKFLTPTDGEDIINNIAN